MSCNNRRKHFFSNLAANDTSLTNSLGDGDTQKAVGNLEAVYQRAGNPMRGIVQPKARELKEAERDCTALFLEFQKKGIAIPTHSKPQAGKVVALPDQQTMLKYAEVYRTIKAASARQPLPRVASAIVDQMRNKVGRAIITQTYTSSIPKRASNTTASNPANGSSGNGSSSPVSGSSNSSSNGGGGVQHQRNRCQNCGRFVAYSLVHNCPMTATPSTMAKALSRRLGISPDAYTDKNGLNRLNDLIREARTHEGTISFIGYDKNCVTTLDGAMIALQQGYLPVCWGLERFTRAVTPSGQIVTVFDPTGMPLPADPTNPVELAALQSGLDPAWVRTHPQLNSASNSVAPTTPNTTTSSFNPNSALLNQAAMATLTVLSTSSNLNNNPLNGVVSSNNSPQTLILAGGSLYDNGRLDGHEYRKGLGSTFQDGNTTYQVGDTSYSAADYATARQSGMYPKAPGGGIRVGQDLVKAAIMLRDARLIATGDRASGNLTFELVNSQSGLVAAYQPGNETLGSVHNPTNSSGEPTSSPEQMAALISYMVTNPTTPIQTALAKDVGSYLAGRASALKVADGAYIAIKEQFKSDPSLRYELGSGLGGVTNCPNCGRFVGVAPCQCLPAVRAVPNPTPGPATSATATTISPEPGSITGSGTVASNTSTTTSTPPNITPVAPFDATQSTPSTQPSPTPATFVLDSEQFARTLGETLAASYAQAASATAGAGAGDGGGGGGGGGNQSPNAAASADPNGEMREALAKMSAAIATLAERTTTAGPTPQEERIASILDNIVTRLNTVSPSATTLPGVVPRGEGEGEAGVTAPPAALNPSLPPVTPLLLERKPLPRQPVRPAPDQRSSSPVEHMLKHVEPVEAPDPYLMAVDPSLGGQRLEPLPLYYQPLDPNFDISADTEKAIRTISASLQIAWNTDKARRPKGTQFRAFALGGTSGTGKNTTARQIAAAVRLPYYEMTINKDTSIQEEIGQTVLTTDPTTGATVSKAQLGKLGQAAASGAVICVNELVKANPGILGALQTMMEDGYIEIAGTEAGMKGGRIPVHSSTVFIGTFNPGYDGSAQRPDAALLSRMQTVILNAPSVDEQAQRLQKEMNSIFGTAAGVRDGNNSGGGQSGSNGSAEILARDYKIQTPANISSGRAKAAASFVSDLQRMARGDGIDVPRQIATASPHPAEPTPREAARFLAISEATGDPLLALEQFRVYCDAGEDAEEQWGKVRQAFTRYYGDDGQDLNRSEAGLGPLVY